MTFNTHINLETPRWILEKEPNKPTVSPEDLAKTKKETGDSLYGPFTPSPIDTTDNKEFKNNKSENLKTFITDIHKDIKNKEGFKEKFEDFDFSIIENKESESEFKSEFLNKVGSNYSEGLDTERQLSEAIIETRVQILKECKNLDIESETFKTAISNIESWNILEQLEWIESLYVLAYSNEWVLWAKVLSNYKEKRKKKLEKKWIKIEEEIVLAKKNNNQEKLIELNKEKEKIIKEMSELTLRKDWKKVEWWSVFKATKIDTTSSNVEK
jgi:hypothetical protein